MNSLPACRHSTKNLTVGFLSSVLKLSVFLEIADGEEFATTRLPTLPDFMPVLQMYLGRLYRIDHWVELAFRKLMTLPSAQLQLEDAQRMGLPFYHVLMKTKVRIDQHRRNLAFSAPKAVTDPLCLTSMACSVSWTSEWWRGLAKQLLHPDAALNKQEILAGFDTVMIPGMCDSCQTQSIEWVKARNVFMLEESYIEEAVKEVMAIQTEEPIRAAMRLHHQ